MPPNHAQLEAMSARIANLETLVIGNPSSPEKALQTRVQALEFTHKTTTEQLLEIRTILSRVMWIMIAGVVVALLNLVIARPGAVSPATQTTSIQTAGSTGGIPTKTSRRDYLTVTDLADIEEKSPRTIQLWASENRITGALKDAAGNWTFPADYRILPQSEPLSPPLAATTSKPPSSTQ